MAELADQYKDARNVSALQATGKGKMHPPKKGDEGKKQNRVKIVIHLKNRTSSYRNPNVHVINAIK